MGAGGPQFQSGNNKYKLEDYRGAIEDYNQAITENKDYAYAYCYRGNCKKKLGYYQSALPDYQKALQLSPNNPFFLFCLASVNSKIENQQKAMEYYQRGQKQFNSKSELTLRSQYLFNSQNIEYIKRSLKQYQSLKKSLNALQEAYIQQNGSEIGARVSKIKDKYTKQWIETLNLDQSKQNDNEIKSKLVEDYNKELQQIKNQLQQQKAQNQEIKAKNQVLLKKVYSVGQKVNDVKQRVTNIEQNLQNVIQRVYAVDNVKKSIDKLDQKLKEYYNIFYNMVITHFLAYRLISTGFFTEKNRQVSTFDKIIGKICKAESVIKKIPVIGNLVGIPFDIINFVREDKSEHLNQVIADKINKSVFRTEEKISSTMAQVIIRLIENEELKSKLQYTIQQQKQSYINLLMKFVKSARDKVYEKFLKGTASQYSYAKQAAILHMTHLTIKIYNCTQSEFLNASEDEVKFYCFVSEAILKPDLTNLTPKEQSWWSRIFCCMQESSTVKGFD